MSDTTLTGEVDWVSHGDGGTKTQHSMERQHVLHTILTHDHHDVILTDSVPSQSTCYTPDGVTCLRKRVRLARQTIHLQHSTASGK